MGISKIRKSNGAVLIDLTSDTVSAENLLLGETAHGADGEPITGEYVPASIWKAYIKIHSCAGATVTASGTNGNTYQETVPSTGVLTLTVTEADTFTVSATYSETTESDTVIVSSREQTYETYLINRRYLYRSGDEFPLITGGWSLVNGMGSVTKDAEYMTFYRSTAAVTYVYLAAVERVDLTNVSTIYFYGNYYPADSYTASLCVTEDRVIGSGWGDLTAYVLVSHTSDPAWYALDVSGLIGYYYIGFTTTARGGNRAYIREVYMV